MIIDEIITTATDMDDYEFKLSIQLDSACNNSYSYSIWLILPYEVIPVECNLGEHTFKKKPSRKQLENLAKSRVQELQETLTALVNALPNAESVRNGVHEL